MALSSPAAISIGSLDPTWATFILALAVLAAGVYLITQALKSDNSENAKLVFTTVGVLFGLLAAGGVGTLFAKQAAESAESAATGTAATVIPHAANAAANQVSEEVSQQVEEALKAPPASDASPGPGKAP